MKDICSVTDNTKNGKIRNVFSVLAGVFIGAAIALPVWLLAAILINPDEGLSESKVIWSVVVIASGFIAGSFAGGYTTARLSTGNEMIYLFFTAAILLCLFLFSLISTSGIFHLSNGH